MTNFHRNCTGESDITWMRLISRGEVGGKCWWKLRPASSLYYCAASWHWASHRSAQSARQRVKRAEETNISFFVSPEKTENCNGLLDWRMIIDKVKIQNTISIVYIASQTCLICLMWRVVSRCRHGAKSDQNLSNKTFNMSNYYLLSLHFSFKTMWTKIFWIICFKFLGSYCFFSPSMQE